MTVSERTIVGCFFIILGILITIKGRVGLECTDIILKGLIAKIIGLIFVGLGVYLLLT